MMKLVSIFKGYTKDIAIVVGLSLILICAYLLYIFQPVQEIPFIYNQF